MLYSLPNKNGQPIPINKVRIYQPTVTNPLHIKAQRDKNLKQPKTYKEHYHVANDGNYLMAIYEGLDDKGKIKRDYRIVNNITASTFFKLSNKGFQSQFGKIGLVDWIQSELEPSCKIIKILKAGQQVLLYRETADELWEMEDISLSKRLYIIRGIDDDGIKLYYHQEARPTVDVIKSMNEAINTTYSVGHHLDLKKVFKLLKEHKVPISSEKAIDPVAIFNDGIYEISDSNGSCLLKLEDVSDYLKVSKLTTPKGGDVIDKNDIFPYVKFKASNFNALIEGVDFIIDPLGKIKKTI